MKINHLAFFSLLMLLSLFIALPQLLAQEGKSEQLVLRKVYMSPVEHSIADPEFELPSLYAGMPEVLARLLTSKQPIILVDEESAAHTFIRIVFAPSEAEAETQMLNVKVIAVRQSDSFVLAELGGSLPTRVTHSEYYDVVQLIADDLAPLLDKVPPEIELRQLAAGDDSQELLDLVLVEKSSLRPYEFSLTAGLLNGFTMQPAQDDQQGLIDPRRRIFSHYSFVFPHPIIADAAWFFKPSHGLGLSLFSTINSYYRYGFVQDSDQGIRAQSFNLMFLPGLAYSFRTGGRLSAGISVGYNAGIMYLRALEEMRLMDDSTLQAGDSRLMFKNLLLIRPNFVWTINQDWGIKISVATLIFDLDRFSMIRLDDDQLLSIGVVYRSGDIKE